MLAGDWQEELGTTAGGRGNGMVCNNRRNEWQQTDSGWNNETDVKRW